MILYEEKNHQSTPTQKIQIIETVIKDTKIVMTTVFCLFKKTRRKIVHVE